MNEEYFKQTHFFKFREFKIKEDHLAVREGNWLSKNVYKIPFENILDDTFEVTEYSKPFFWIACIFSFLSISLLATDTPGDNEIPAYVFYGSIGLIFWVLTYISRETYLGITGVNQPVIFFKYEPSQRELNEFIDKLLTRKNAYLKDNFVISDQPISIVDELQKLAWLKEHGAISETEFEDIKKQIVGNNEKRGPMGFSS